MLGKFAYGGEGASVPGTDFGLSFGLFKLWLAPTGGSFCGYTTASNNGLLGAAIVESPVVDFMMYDIADEEPFTQLHGSSAEVSISSSVFVVSGGTSTLKLKLFSNDGLPPKELEFFSDECKGFFTSIGDINFRTTLLQLPADEWDAYNSQVVPW